jgi:phage tail-like protein
VSEITLMTTFAVTALTDPYKNYKFRVQWDGRYVAGVSKISALRRSTQVIEHREGGDPSTSRKSSGVTHFEPIVLERGVTQDTAFEAWANLVWPGDQSGNFRKEVTIDLFDDADRLVLRYVVHRCWVSEYQALPDLDANGPTIAIQSIKLENEGWERDMSVAPPAEAKVSS